MKTLVLMAVSCCLATTAQAQVRRDRAEKGADRRALRQDHREKADDRADVARLAGLLARFDAARSSSDQAGLSAVNAELKNIIEGEVRESRWESAKDRQELRQDNRELRADRREVGQDRGRPLAAADDRHDLRDDRRDRRDDVRDVAAESATRQRVMAIGSQLAALGGAHDNGSLDKTRALIVELQRLAAGELAADRQETREDRRELKEDRRELREDRRQR